MNHPHEPRTATPEPIEFRMGSYSWAFLGSGVGRSRQADKGIAQGVSGILRDFLRMDDTGAGL
jgi:hypothetical protein